VAAGVEVAQAAGSPSAAAAVGERPEELFVQADELGSLVVGQPVHRGFEHRLPGAERVARRLVTGRRQLDRYRAPVGAGPTPRQAGLHQPVDHADRRRMREPEWVSQRVDWSSVQVTGQADQRGGRRTALARGLLGGQPQAICDRH
jgi:hypothetical protein